MVDFKYMEIFKYFIIYEEYVIYEGCSPIVLEERKESLNRKYDVSRE